MSRIVSITGATGFIGRRTVELLLAQGLGVRALAREPRRLAVPSGEGVEIVAGDLANGDALDRLARGSFAVIHCAGEIADPSRYRAANVDGAKALAAAARRQSVAGFVHVSSLAAREPGLSDYGDSKLQGEDAVREAFGATATIVRPPAVYGPGDRATLPLIAQLTRSTAILPGTAGQRFSLVHVDDLARALVALAIASPREGAMHEPHDGRQEGYAWSDLAAIAGGAQGRRVRVVHIPHAVLSMAAVAAESVSRLSGGRPALTRGKVAELYHRDWVCRAGEVPGWRPKMAFAEGFADTLAWYRRHGWLRLERGANSTPATAI